MTVVQKGDTVKVDYEGTFEDGSVFDSSKERGPLEFTVGGGQMIKGFDAAVQGMQKGDQKDITLEPSEAYGEYHAELLKKVPKEQLPEGAKAGMMVGVGLPTGKQVPAKIIEVSDKEATLDLNHPLAGKTLKFNITLVDIQEGKQETADADEVADALKGNPSSNL